MSEPRERSRRLRILILALALGVVVFALTEIPYRVVEAWTPDDYVFVTPIALAMDINSYYSFIQQAKAGHWLFRNNMTHEPHEPAFFNLEWLALGKCMAWFDWNERQSFVIWRAAGSVMLLAGFAVLAIAVLPRTSQRLVALLLCAFGGGFGWIMAGLDLAGLLSIDDPRGLKNPGMDHIFAIHPFSQIMKNPHYSLPHGTYLLFIALFVVAERTRRKRWYAAAAAMALVQGLMRPYDLMTLYALIPVYIAVEAICTRTIDVKRELLRMLPLLVTAPVLAYYAYLFVFHPVFSFWASQGDQPPPNLLWHCLTLGLVGMLVLFRSVRHRAYPFSDPAERLLLIWAASIFVLFHANNLTRLLSFSPQIGVPLISPLILLAVGLLPPLEDRWKMARPVAWKLGVASFVMLNALSTPLYAVYGAQMGAVSSRNFLRKTDLDAIQWLDQHTTESDVVLASEPMGSRIAFFAHTRVALGHWALTPHIKRLKKKTSELLEGEMTPQRAARFIDELNATYVYCTDSPGYAGPEYFERVPGLQMAYSNRDVAIFEVNTYRTDPDRS